MPLWQIYHSPGAFTETDKKGLSKAITNVYSTIVNLPDFYAIVVFIPLEDIYMGGEKATNFVRLVGSHLARVSTTEPTRLNGFMGMFDAALAPYIKERGMDWEYSFDNSPREFWKINGMIPPPAESDGEKLWKKENKPVAYQS